jgi:hypothetical protein
MTQIDWPGTARTMKWILSTFDCLVESCRSAPDSESKLLMVRFIADLPMPDLEQVTKPIPDEYKALMDDSKRAQDEFQYWRILSGMMWCLDTSRCALEGIRRGYCPTEKDKRATVRMIERQRSDWLGMPDFKETELPGVADVYKTLMDEWERVEHEVQEWQLRETPAVGSVGIGRRLELPVRIPRTTPSLILPSTRTGLMRVVCEERRINRHGLRSSASQPCWACAGADLDRPAN